MQLINFKNVKKSFNGRMIIQDLNFSIYDNEIVALIGTNGAGKTTTLRMLLNISQPDSGTITRWRSDFKKNIGAQLQTTPFFEDYSVLDNLKLFATFYAVTLSPQDEDEILANFQLADVKNTLAGRLSLGQQKRLAISITTLHQPKFVILDEPSAGLDPSGQRAIQNMIKQLKKSGKTVLFSSHDMLEVQSTADRILLLDKGQILADGAPAELLQHYQTTNLEELFYKLTHKENSYA